MSDEVPETAETDHKDGLKKFLLKCLDKDDDNREEVPADIQRRCTELTPEVRCALLRKVIKATKWYGGYDENDPEYQIYRMGRKLDDRFYHMERKRRGYYLLINNENFPNPKDKREGTTADGLKLSSLFKELSFEPFLHPDPKYKHLTVEGEEYRDLSAAQIRELVQKFSQFEGHKQADATIFCILSHGGSDGLLGSDGNWIKQEDIWRMFIATNCEHLLKKPKIFIFVACRGGSDEDGRNREGIQPPPLIKTSEKPANISKTCAVVPDVQPPAGEQPILASPTVYVPRTPDHADFLYVFSTLEGQVSARHPLLGTPFVEDFCTLVESDARHFDLLTLLTWVNGKAVPKSYTYKDEKGVQHRTKQTTTFSSTLSKSLFFNPKLPEEQMDAEGSMLSDNSDRNPLS